MNVTLKQMVKYGLVGILNTLLTAAIIWISLYILSDRDTPESPSASVMFIANSAGYLAGLINSFILNRNWTFKSKSDWKLSLLRFLIAFAVCYCLQLGVVLWLNSLEIITPAYICQLAGIAVYSVLNFFLNKHYAFGAGKPMKRNIRNNSYK
ncbi:MAG: GtrA family protein [Mediterranea sp.]|jgi:putative flippase GtrA|nr:GtrA family protein [Mediterranea sp.]